MTIALIVVVAISLSLLGTGLLFIKQVQSTQTYWQSKVEISVYLCTADSANPNCHGAYTSADQQSLMSRLNALPQVAHVYFQPQDQAYAQFKTFFANDQAYVSTVKPSDI